MTELKKIVAQKKREVAENRQQTPIEQLTQQPLFQSPTASLSSAVKTGSGVIAEYKRCSPSAGVIQEKTVEEVLSFYHSHELSAYSILTDRLFFGGDLADMATAKQMSERPVLRKDFIIDEYQLFEAKSQGADAVLLIAALLDGYHAQSLVTVAHSIGLEVLMEFHDPKEMSHYHEAVDVVGVNNRNLDTLETCVATSEKMLKYIPHDSVKITESGLHHPRQVQFLYSLGFDGCLVGESILKQPDLLSSLTAAAVTAKSSPDAS